MPLSLGSQSVGFYVTVATAKGSTTKRVEGDVLTVGRAEDCQLSISHDTLSRRHLTVTLQDGQCWIEDHGSANGTFINGTRIKPHTPTRVLPEDQIALGQSGVRLSVSPEAMMRREGAPPVPAEDSSVTDTIVTTLQAQRRAERAARPVAEPKVPATAQMDAERLVQEAMKKAATIVQEAELEAERRVEDIYRRAHETQAKMDEVYQRRLNEAYRAAELVYQKAQAESAEIMTSARQKSAEVRQQAEGFVMELRRRTEEDCERILEEAQVTARDLKESRLIEAEDIIRRKEEELVQHTRQAMNDRLARFEEGLLAEGERQRAALQMELNDRRIALENELGEKITIVARLKDEMKALADQRESERIHLDDIEQNIKKHSGHLTELKEDIASGKVAAQALDAEIHGMKDEISQLEKGRDKARADHRSAQDQLTRLLIEVKEAQDRVAATKADFDGQIARLRAKFEEEHSRVVKGEQAHLEEMKLETTRKVKELESQLLTELIEKKDVLGREIGLTVESYFKENPGGSLKPLQAEIQKVIDGRVVTMSKDPTAKSKERSLVELKRWEKRRTAFVGAVVGAILAYVGNLGYMHLNGEMTPMQRRLAAAQEEQKRDMERRKFAPAQTKDLRPNYTDAVIYTENFVATYTSDAFQERFRKAVTPYLLKTWRVEEDEVIQVLATASTLVKNLQEKRENIHPDFVPQGVEKMREIEAEAMTKMRGILGTQVRVESFKKYEKQFYEDYKPL